MRVRPVASSGTTPRTKRRLRLGPYVIPAGTLLLMPFDAVHHFRGNWEQPDDFIPVRPCPLLHCSCPGLALQASGMLKNPEYEEECGR